MIPPEQIVNLSQVAQNVTEVIEQTLQQERSLLISSVIEEVNSHLTKNLTKILTDTLTETLTKTLKVYFEEQFERQLSIQLALKEKAYELDLQTKIDELKFQHYQQLERLGQAVEQVMTSQPSEQILDEDEYDLFMDEATDETADEFTGEFADEFDGFTFVESEFFTEDELITSTSESQEKYQEGDANLIQNNEVLNHASEIKDEIELELIIDFPQDLLEESFNGESDRLFESQSVELNLESQFEIKNSDSPETLLESLSENLEDDRALNLFDSDIQGSERDLKLDSEDVNLFENDSVENDFKRYSETELDFDDELNLFDETTNESLDENSGESTDLDFLGITDQNELSDPFEVESNSQFELDNCTDDINDDLEESNQWRSLEIDSIPANNEFDLLTLEDDLREPLQSEIEVDSIIGIDDELNLFDLDDDRELASDDIDEFMAFEKNLKREVEDLKLDDELNLFAESADPDFFGEEIETFTSLKLSDPTLEPLLNEPFNELLDELPDNLSDEKVSSPFSILSFEDAPPEIKVGIEKRIEDIESNSDGGHVNFADYFEDSPEIIYEGEYQFDAELDLEPLDTELSTDIELSEGDRLNLDLERELELELKRELLDSDAAISDSLEHSELEAEINLEIQDDLLSEFADSAEEDFWNSDLDIESPISNLKDRWHLGIDFGYSHTRACLFNQSSDRVYVLNFNGEESIKSVKYLTLESEETASIQGFKQILRLGIPYKSDGVWQPLIKWRNTYREGIHVFRGFIGGLLREIKLAAHPELADVSVIIDNLETVILGHPHSWSDAYIFNLREAVFESGLVTDMEKVLVIDRAIALSFPLMPTLPRQLCIDSGAFTTTLSFALDSSVKPECRFDDLEHAGLGINQDIVLQLLYPKTKDKFPATKFILSGVPNSKYRTDLQQFLTKSPIGLEALAIAEQIKLFFSQEPSAVIWQGSLGGKSLKISRSELEIKVIQPFIQTLNDVTDRAIYGTQPQDITDIAISGGTMQIPELRQWLEAKFANARISILPSSNLAEGLAIAPKHSQYLDINRHQYSDYFLLSEICALNLQEPINLANLMKKLQYRGVNAKACTHRLARILLGQLPAGVLPWREPESLVLPDPNLDPTLLTSNLFTPVGNDLYQPNLAYAQLLGAYLKMLESSIHQSFSEPLVFPSFVV